MKIYNFEVYFKNVKIQQNIKYSIFISISHLEMKIEYLISQNDIKLPMYCRIRKCGIKMT